MSSQNEPSSSAKVARDFVPRAAAFADRFVVRWARDWLRPIQSIGTRWLSLSDRVVGRWLAPREPAVAAASRAPALGVVRPWWDAPVDPMQVARRGATVASGAPSRELIRPVEEAAAAPITEGRDPSVAHDSEPAWRALGLERSGAPQSVEPGQVPGPAAPAVARLARASRPRPSTLAGHLDRLARWSDERIAGAVSVLSAPADDERGHDLGAGSLPSLTWVALPIPLTALSGTLQATGAPGAGAVHAGRALVRPFPTGAPAMGPSSFPSEEAGVGAPPARVAPWSRALVEPGPAARVPGDGATAGLKVQPAATPVRSSAALPSMTTPPSMGALPAIAALPSVEQWVPPLVRAAQRLTDGLSFVRTDRALEGTGTSLWYGDRSMRAGADIVHLDPGPVARGTEAGRGVVTAFVRTSPTARASFAEAGATAGRARDFVRHHEDRVGSLWSPASSVPSLGGSERRPVAVQGPSAALTFVAGLEGERALRDLAPRPVGWIAPTFHARPQVADPRETGALSAAYDGAGDVRTGARVAGLSEMIVAAPALRDRRGDASTTPTLSASNSTVGVAEAGPTRRGPGAVAVRAEQLAGAVAVEATRLAATFVEPERWEALAGLGGPSTMTAGEWALLSAFPSVATAAQVVGMRRSRADATWTGADAATPASPVVAPRWTPGAPTATRMRMTPEGSLVVAPSMVGPVRASMDGTVPAVTVLHASGGDRPGRPGPAEATDQDETRPGRWRAGAATQPLSLIRLPGGERPRGSYLWPQAASDAYARSLTTSARALARVVDASADDRGASEPAGPRLAEAGAAPLWKTLAAVEREPVSAPGYAPSAAGTAGGGVPAESTPSPMELARPLLELIEASGSRAVPASEGARMIASYSPVEQPVVAAASADAASRSLVEAARSPAAAGGSDDRMTLADLTLIAVASASQQLAASPAGGGPAPVTNDAGPAPSSGAGEPQSAGAMGALSDAEVDEMAREVYDALRRQIEIERERSGDPWES